MGKRGEKKASISSQPNDAAYPELVHSESVAKRDRQRSQLSMNGMDEGGASPSMVDHFIKRSAIMSQNTTGTSLKNMTGASPVEIYPKLIPNFDRQGERHTIFS